MITREASHLQARLGAATVSVARRVRVLVVGLAVMASTGCYSYSAVPMTEPLVEQNAEFRISDAGRVQLARALGPGVETVEGRIVRQDANGWTVKVYRIANIRDEVSTWSGEEVDIPASAVELLQRRNLDKQRSVVALAAVAGGVTFFVLTRSIFGGGTSVEGGGTGNPGETIRY